MAHIGDTIRSYRIGLEGGQFDRDLSDRDRAEIARSLGYAERIAYDHGATPVEDLVRMTRDPQIADVNNARTAEILRGCAS